MSDKPYWFPVVCDKAYFKQLREDYPDNASMSDEDLHNHYNEDRKYVVTWDHVGDAYQKYEPLADAFLELVKASEQLLAAMDSKGRASSVRELRAALGKATGKGTRTSSEK
jgi:hypothetical protein